MITYRTFRNWDPPAIVQLWNSSGLGRGAARSIRVSDLEGLVLSKPYFDPRAITLAEDDGRLVGFVHPGFGATADGSRLSREFGVIALLMVAPTHRRRGIGRELVRRAERHLRSGGSTVIYAGGIYPLDPFYLGLYGGSEMPGILQSDAAAHRLFKSLGYRPVDECLVFQRELAGPVPAAGRQVRSWAHRVEFCMDSQPALADWWSVCQYAALEYADFSLRLRDSGELLARARGWEMYPLHNASDALAVGIVNLEVDAAHRGQRLGTVLMIQILRHCRDIGLTLVEIQTMVRNEPARRLYARLGFREVDRGVVYRAS